MGSNLRSKNKDFGFDTPDLIGFVPKKAIKLIGERFVHTTTQKVYIVRGFVWLGEQDLWGIKHQSSDGVEIVRSSRNFFGRVANGDKRFTPYVEHEP